MHAAGYLEHEISQRVRKSLEFIFYYTKNDTKGDNRMTIKNTTPITMAHNPAQTATSQVEFQLEWGRSADGVQQIIHSQPTNINKRCRAK